MKDDWYVEVMWVCFEEGKFEMVEIFVFSLKMMCGDYDEIYF